MPILRRKTQPKNDVDYSFLAVSFGATAFFTLCITTLPAIITGVIALVKHNGKKSQAIIGIVLGLIAPIAYLIIGALLFMKFIQPRIEEQSSISNETKSQLTGTADKLILYAQKYGELPQCYDITTESRGSCPEWNTFTSEYNPKISDKILFSNDSSFMSQEPGTTVYANQTTCLLNEPINPDTFDEEPLSEAERSLFAALVYYHNDGKTCVPVTFD